MARQFWSSDAQWAVPGLCFRISAASRGWMTGGHPAPALRRPILACGTPPGMGNVRASSNRFDRWSEKDIRQGSLAALMA